MKVDIPTLEVLASVHLHQPKFVEWLESRLARHRDEALSARDEIDVRLAQGRGQELANIIKLMKDANETLRKAESRSSNVKMI
jgi:hypothetical protein